MLGKWSQECHDELEAGNRESKSHITQANFSEKQLNFQSTFFKRRGCRASALSYEGIFKYTTTSEPLIQIDYIVEEISVTPLTKADAQRLKESHFCGIKDWQPDLATKVTGLRCFDTEPPFPEKGAPLYDVYEISDGKLFLGLSSLISHKASSKVFDGSSPEKRPPSTEKDSPFFRIEGN